MSKNIGELSEYYTLLKITKDKRINILSNNGHSVDCSIENMFFGNSEKSFSWLTEEELDQSIIDFQLAIESLRKKEPLVLTDLAKKIIDECPKTGKKADLSLKLNYKNIHDEVKQGFSVKSFLGANPTLLNASSHTRLKYKIKNIEFDKIKNIKEPKELIQFILNNDGEILFESFDSSVFCENLEFIDSNLPLYIAKLLIENYRNVKSVQNLSAISSEVFKDTKLRQVNRKVSELLYQCMAGMSPSKKIEESGNLEGGLIILDNNYAVHSFSSYSEQSVVKLKRKLLEHSYFESASTSRHDYGYAFTEGESIYMKLVLQVRLMKFTNK